MSRDINAKKWNIHHSFFPHSSTTHSQPVMRRYTHTAHSPNLQVIFYFSVTAGNSRLDHGNDWPAETCKCLSALTFPSKVDRWWGRTPCAFMQMDFGFVNVPCGTHCLGLDPYAMRWEGDAVYAFQTAPPTASCLLSATCTSYPYPGRCNLLVILLSYYFIISSLL